MKKIVFLVVALFMSSLSVMATAPNGEVVSLGLQNESSFNAFVYLNFNNYDVFHNGQKILESEIIVGAHNIDWLLPLAPKVEKAKDLPDEASFSISRRRPWWPFRRDTLNFKLVLITSSNRPEVFLRGEDGQNVTRLFKDPFTVECYRGELEGRTHFFVLDISQRDTIDGSIRDKFAQHCHCF